SEISSTSSSSDPGWLSRRFAIAACTRSRSSRSSARKRSRSMLMRSVYVGLRGFALARPRVLAVVLLLRLRRCRRVVDRLERRAQLRLDPARLRDQPLVLGDRVSLQLPRLRMRLAEDQLRFAPRLLLQLRRRAFRRHQRRAQQRLELLEAHEVGLELLDLVREVGALAPHVFEA